MSFPMLLTIDNPSTSGALDSQIHVGIVGQDPNDASKYGHLDFNTNTFVSSPRASWQFDPTTMSMTLDKVKQINTVIKIPKIVSGRVYFSIFKPFQPFNDSGPQTGSSNDVVYDKVEFDTASNPNVNGTNVDFYGFSYTVTGTDNNTGQKRTIGFMTQRSTIINAFRNLAAATTNPPTSPPTTPDSGNTDIFKMMVLTDASKNVTRVLAPKAAGLEEWGKTQADFVKNAAYCSHFLDEYVNKHCWKPSRTFSFYDKFYNPNDPHSPKNEVFGKVDSTGTVLHLFTDAAHTQPYKVPSLPRPSVARPAPDFTPQAGQKNLYQNQDSTIGAIDWGFLIMGNAGLPVTQNSPSNKGSYWQNDPAAMAIIVSICRGVMHLDNGTTDWVKPALFYQGDKNLNSNNSGKSIPEFPILYFAKLLHDNSLNHAAYALSYDDIYGNEPTIFFGNHPDITITLNSVQQVNVRLIGTNPTVGGNLANRATHRRSWLNNFLNWWRNLFGGQ